MPTSGVGPMRVAMTLIFAINASISVKPLENKCHIRSGGKCSYSLYLAFHTTSLYMNPWLSSNSSTSSDSFRSTILVNQSHSNPHGNFAGSVPWRAKSFNTSSACWYDPFVLSRVIKVATSKMSISEFGFEFLDANGWVYGHDL
eukprot:3264629-Rhodomonas_salina.2